MMKAPKKRAKSMEELTKNFEEIEEKLDGSKDDFDENLDSTLKESSSEDNEKQKD